MELIDKDVLLMEIENRIDRRNTKKWSCPANTQVEAICDNKICAYKEILSFLNTTEVKEVEEVPAEVQINSYGNKYISTWSGLKEYNNYQTGKQIKVLIPKQ